MTMAETAAAAPPSSNPTQSVLSQKVAHTLQVRTDTPAMKAALEALSQLSDRHALDARRVKIAIEQDALQQAVLLQKELRSVVDTVQALRKGISETAEIARKVKTATHTVLVTEASAPVVKGDPLLGGSSMENSITSGTESSVVVDDPEDDAEVKLARTLADAFVHRDGARQRLEAVHAFLERFDLSPEDARLLDHYAFEDVANGLGSKADMVNGLAFLNALERVRNIRSALTDSFGGSSQGEVVASSSSSQRRAMGSSTALRMMENLAQKQERAYERLYHWVQQYLNLMTKDNANDDADEEVALQHSFVKQAIFTLRYVPAFYSHTLELIAGSRRSAVTRRFLLALTSGYGGLQPIEMKAHDPVACKYMIQRIVASWSFA